MDKSSHFFPLTNIVLYLIIISNKILVLELLNIDEARYINKVIHRKKQKMCKGGTLWEIFGDYHILLFIKAILVVLVASNAGKAKKAPRKPHRNK